MLDCYRLARWYRQSPTTFLEMPLSEVLMHLERTYQLASLMRQQTEDDDG